MAPPFDVYLLLGNAKGLHPCQRHAGKGLVDFEAIDLVQVQAGAFQRQAGTGDDAIEHFGGIDAPVSVGKNTSPRLETELFGYPPRHPQGHGGAIADSGGSGGMKLRRPL